MSETASSSSPLDGDPSLLLYQVLIDEYRSQEIEPAIPKDFVDGLEARHRNLERDLTGMMDAAARLRSLDSELVHDFYAWLHEHHVKRSALCFSGGGIRSATFGLGILQGLARLKLVGNFDFLSTVSGGGYLGGWLTAWIHREHEKLARAGQEAAVPQSPGSRTGRDTRTTTPVPAVLEIERQLSDPTLKPLSPEPEPVRHLRSYSRYMSPRVGFLSADTWTLVAIYLRNILLNWTVLLPLIAAALMFPRLSTLLLRLPLTQRWTGAQNDGWEHAVLWVSVLFGVVAFAHIMINRPSLAARARWPFTPGASWRGIDLRGQSAFLVLCLLPLWLFALGVTVYWAWLAPLRFDLFGYALSPLFAFVIFGTGVACGGFVLSRFWVRISGVSDLYELLAVALTGALGGMLAWTMAHHCFPALNEPVPLLTYVCIGGPLTLLVFLTAASLFVGVASRFTSDDDREWLARTGAWILIVIAMRSLISAVVIFGPLALVYSFTVGVPTTVAGVASAWKTLHEAFSGKTAAVQKEPAAGGEAAGILSKIGHSAILLVFCLFLLSLLSLATSLLLRWIQADADLPAWTIAGADTHPWDMLNIIYSSPWGLVSLALGAFVGLGLLMGFFININKFSLHAAYRDRLIRAYLGASRSNTERRPNPFTGFDENDNLQMRELKHPRPLHLLNLTLNLVGGKDLAWQDRKAESFTVSRRHAGSHCVGYRSATQYAYNRGVDKAITLGTAVAISGAAASPNMGYHSSPLITFLMTLFNVRLGWWLGNTGEAGKSSYMKPGPVFAPQPLIAEAFGRTDDQNHWIYLSDGGHFENLGLYEMVLRRCHFIVVSDGSQDPKFGFESLGDAVSKIRIDLGIPIVFEKLLMQPRDPGEKSSYNLSAGTGVPYCAIGHICYSCVDAAIGGQPAEDGLLLYIKASLNGTEPVDVYHYAKDHPDFPHEPTENQLYTEAQFESYRALGSHVVDWIVEQLEPVSPLPDRPSLEQFFKALQQPTIAGQFGKLKPCTRKPRPPARRGGALRR